MIPTDVLKSVVDNLSAVRSVNNISVALLTVMVYDTILTMPREIEFIWKTGDVSLPKILYIICRYHGFISIAVITRMSVGSNLSIESCHIYINWLTGSSLQIEEGLVNFLLIMRINALYGGQRKVLLLLLTLYFVELVLFFYCGIRVARVVKPTPLPNGLSLSGCYIYFTMLPNLSFTLLAWISALVFSSILLSFSAYKAYQDLSPVASTRRSWKLTWLNLHHPLLLAIFQQGVVFYIVNTVITLLNAALVTRIHTVFDSIAVPIGVVAYSICGCRFLLGFHDLSNTILHNAPNTDGVVVFHTTDEAYMLNTI